MSTGLILAIDQGTTNTKALLVDGSGTPLFRTASSLSLITSQGGFVEQDAMAIWASVLEVIACAVKYTREDSARIEAIAISNQRETALAWNAETLEPLAGAVSWQCCRSAAICDRMATMAADFRAKTGLPLAPLVSAGKWAWLMENVPGVDAASRNGTLHFGTVDAWLMTRLTGGSVHLTDLTNASRTGLLNLESLGWDQELLRAFGIPLAAMPSLKCSSGYLGTCTSVPALSGVPVLAAIGDSHGALFGHARFTPGSVKATYGTGSSLMALTSELVGDTPMLARTIAWSLKSGTQFALEGNIAMTGAAVQWLGEFLHLPDPAAEVARLAATVTDAGGVYFVPAMLGLGAPYWDAEARGSITGLGRNHTSAHTARAAIDAISYQVADVFGAMENAAQMTFDELLADGGATRNATLMQFQADILNRPVLRSRNEELSAIGAAWLAGLELGWWESLSDLQNLSQNGDRFEPKMESGVRDHLLQGWSRAVAGVRTGLRSAG